MRELLLVGGQTTLVDDGDYVAVASYKWYLTTSGYAISKIDGRMTYLHRLLTGAPNGVYVDHINRDKLDNRRSNLRTATPAQNTWNMGGYRNRTQGQYKGVRFKKRNTRRPWDAMIMVNGVQKYLGAFETEIEAALAYDRAAREYYGMYAYLNFPEVG